MMTAVDRTGHSHSHVHGARDFPGRGLHLGHFRGTAEGPPGLRPAEAESAAPVGGAERDGAIDALRDRLIADPHAVFVDIDADANGALSPEEFYDFSNFLLRDSLSGLLAPPQDDAAGDAGETTVDEAAETAAADSRPADAAPADAALDLLAALTGPGGTLALRDAATGYAEAIAAG